MLEYILFFMLIAVAIATLSLFIHYLDRNRIRRYLLGQGATLIRAEYESLGNGWFGDDKNNIYRVTYLDRDKNRHSVQCKTSIFGGVYFTMDSTLRMKHK